MTNRENKTLHDHRESSGVFVIFIQKTSESLNINNN